MIIHQYLCWWCACLPEAKLSTRKVQFCWATFLIFLGMYNVDYAFEQSRSRKLFLLSSCSFWKCQNIVVAPNIATNYQSSELSRCTDGITTQKWYHSNKCSKDWEVSKFHRCCSFLGFQWRPPPSATFMATLIDSALELTIGLICGSMFQWPAESMD